MGFMLNSSGSIENIKITTITTTEDKVNCDQLSLASNKSGFISRSVQAPNRSSRRDPRWNQQKNKHQV